MKLNVPPTPVGVPLIAPVVEFKDKPGGRLPLVIPHVEYGGAPPVAARVCEYVLPIFPFGNAVAVVIAGFEADTGAIKARRPSN